MKHKNEIIEKVVDSLLMQRKNMTEELSIMNHNEASYMERRMTLENAINKIDMEVNNHLMNCHISQL